ncbi:MAG: hypothetical protein V4547_17965 [Bacteroidota bacterium]
MKPKLAILIPTIEGRENFFNRIIGTLEEQKKWFPDNDVIIITLKDAGYRNGGMSIGNKRNELIKMAVNSGASHRAFIDDDDMVSTEYLKLNMPGVYGNYDCNSLVGIYSENGQVNPKKHIFIHSLKYTHWWEDDTMYYRNPNHLNVIKLELVKDIIFEDKNDGEDGVFSEELARQDRVKTEFEIAEPFYQYLFRSKENGI